MRWAILKRGVSDVNTFREEIDYVEDMLQDQKDANIVMYCTGGIRCEKASAYLKHKGFQNVHQLEGGIIEYTRQAKAEGLRTNSSERTSCLTSAWQSAFRTT